MFFITQIYETTSNIIVNALVQFPNCHQIRLAVQTYLTSFGDVTSVTLSDTIIDISLQATCQTLLHS